MEISLFEKDPQRGVVLIVAGLAFMLGGSLHSIFAKYAREYSTAYVTYGAYDVSKKKFERFTV